MKKQPYEYLTYLFEQLPNTDITDVNSLDKLLPWSETIPENCKAPAETEEEKLETRKRNLIPIFRRRWGILFPVTDFYEICE